MKKISCIYLIRSNIKPERYYIGSTCNYCERKRQHLSSLRKNRHHSPLLQRHINKYGIDDISFEFLEVVIDNSILEQREQFFITELVPYFNMNLTAARKVGEKRSQEYINSLRLRMIGTSYASGKRTEDAKARISESKKGCYRSPEAIEKHRQKMIGRPGIKGWHHTDEAKAKIKATSLGRFFTDKSRKKLSLAKMGQTPFKGRSHSQGAKDKIREARKQYWLKRKAA